MVGEMNIEIDSLGFRLNYLRVRWSTVRAMRLITADGRHTHDNQIHADGNEVHFPRDTLRVWFTDGGWSAYLGVGSINYHRLLDAWRKYKVKELIWTE